MAKVREYNFPTGFETSTIPDPGTPSASNDTISYGYLNDKSYWGAAVADYTALKALTSAARADNQIRQVDATPTELWKFDSSSATADNGTTVLQPSDLPGTGRWLKIETSGGGASTGAAGVEVLKHKAEMEHYDTITPPIENSVASGFANAKQTVNGTLLADHTSGTTLYLAWNPMWINDSDKNTDSTTGWAAGNADTTGLTTSVTRKIGATSLSFDKSGTAGTNTRIVYDIGSATKSINGNTDLYVWYNMPSVTNFSNFECRVEVDAGTNYQTFTTAVDHTGASAATGWQLVKFDLSTGGSATGTGWDKSKLFRRLAIGVNVSSAAQTYTAILIDAIHFSIINPTQLVQARNEYDIYDTSNVDSFIIDNSSTRVAGAVTLAASLTQAYSGGSGSSIRRQTATIAGDNMAKMEDGLSGEIADTQTVRLQRVLNGSISSQTLKAFTNCNTQHFFEVLTVPTTGQITVSDASDSTANLVSGKTLHVFKVHYDADGQKAYEYRDLDLTISSSSYSTGVTTINNSGSNSGIAVGDIVILKPQTTTLSLVAATGANENFQTPTLDDILVTDLGVQYPNPASTYAHWTLSGSQGYKSLKGSLGKDLTVSGTPTTNYDFKNGQYATGGWTDSNYFSLTTADSANITGLAGGLDLSFWFYATAFTGTFRGLIMRYTTGSTSGWRIGLDGAANNILFRLNASDVVTAAFTANSWVHVVARLESGVASYIYVNSVKSAVSATGFSNANNTLYIGRGDGAGVPASGVYMTDVLFNYNSTAWTQGQVESLYNRGLHRILSYAPGIDYRYSITAQTGQVLSQKIVLDRTTDACKVFVGSAGVIKS